MNSTYCIYSHDYCQQTHYKAFHVEVQNLRFGFTSSECGVMFINTKLRNGYSKIILCCLTLWAIFWVSNYTYFVYHDFTALTRISKYGYVPITNTERIINIGTFWIGEISLFVAIALLLLVSARKINRVEKWLVSLVIIALTVNLLGLWTSLQLCRDKT